MATFRDLRKTVRESLDDPRLAVVFFETDNSSSYHFANVLNLGIQGVLIESDKKFENGIKPKLMMKNPELDQWDTFFCRVAWAQTTESEKQYKTGLEFLFPVDSGIEPEPGINGDITPQDIDFLLTTRLFKAVPKGFLCSLLNCLSRRSVAQNTRFMSRENPQNCLYIIHKGICRLEFKNKTGLFESIGKRREGDMIGDMAFLSTESLISDAVSESEMMVWELPAAKFDQACRLQQGLIDFLTGLLTNRFDDPTDPELKTVGRYIITQLIGEGRTGFVYKGLHKPLSLPVAVKMMKHHQAAQKDVFNRFKQKISRIADLNHPNIVQLYDIEERYRTFFIIMEYIEGNDLNYYIDKIDIKDTLQFQNFLKELQQRVENIPVIMLHFAFNPKEEILRSVLNWFLENLKKEVVLDIEVDQNLIGGAVVVYNGIYKDYSLRKKFEDKIKMGEIKLGLDSS